MLNCQIDIYLIIRVIYLYGCFILQGLNKVRALNLANSGRREYESKSLAKMSNLHFLVLDGCNVSGDLESISEELRWLRWRYMPLTFIPPTLKLINLISLDFSYSTMLASTWIESDQALEVCCLDS